MKNKKLLFLALLTPLYLLSKEVEIYSSPFCGCCIKWGDYLQNNGYQVTHHKNGDFMAVKEKYKIAPQNQSCHTGIIEGYAIEGHVPLDAINWLLENKPENVVGISTPGMPIGSPGMEQGNMQEEYPVVLLYKNGDSKVFGIYKGETLIKKQL
ncbi:DUF411 domain-containing protein [Helicobacter canadensis]|uniref:DUF411 domain-containing protein n=1 Tax=Helicobacter canadensis MIT 98-5491 TaxID=537970 RepID=C5ZX69_9HELI|nr:DUF411 domain-containing protein [Helicobacter canadensis]EES89737.1 conserved hypothetical protein [Helicobacter canadensis MIT 98-5491]EFR48530.1 hypothetical protein HCMG_00703 [Helicobacter canadensis MIT 98-5491]STO99775.1 Protein of uncharacterised function, DUF [Helicobacter canadensis]